MDLTNQVFGAFGALHVYSDADVIFLEQGGLVIKFPADLAPMVMEALQLARQGEM